MRVGMAAYEEYATQKTVLVCVVIVVVFTFKYACLTRCGRSQRVSLEDPELPRMQSSYHRFRYHALPLVPPSPYYK